MTPTWADQVAQWGADYPSPGERDPLWSSRQESMYYFIEDIARYQGKFNKSSDPDGAHYFDGTNNPFKGENLKCQNCAFYMADGTIGTCEAVEGIIDPQGLCKLWIIPESVIGTETETAGKMKKPKKKKSWSY